MHRIIAEKSFEAAPVTAERARWLLEQMVRARTFDERAIALQRRGWISGYPPYRGQEASQIGTASALTDSDWLVPTYRANAMQFARGVPFEDILRFRRGHPEFDSEHELPILPQAVPIATQLPHAAGIGMAIDYTGDDARVLCYFGDGATSEGDFHEALNFAGVFEAPVVFLCENNHWAISLPRDRQTRANTIAQKATAYGIAGMRVDGNDPIAVADTVETALERAESDEPVLVESLTYRQGPHSTSDDPDRYRDDEIDLPDWRTADPIERFTEYLTDADVIDAAFNESVREAARSEIDDAVDRIKSEDEGSAEELFDPVYEELPPRLARQRASHQT